MDDALDNKWVFMYHSANLMHELNTEQYVKFSDDEITRMQNTLLSWAVFDGRTKVKENREKLVKAVSLGIAGIGVMAATGGLADAAILAGYAITQNGIVDNNARKTFDSAFDLYVRKKFSDEIKHADSIIDNKTKAQEIYTDFAKRKDEIISVVDGSK